MKLDSKLDAKTIAGLKLPDGKDEEIFWDGELEDYGCRLRRNDSGKIRKSLVVQYRRGARLLATARECGVVTAIRARRRPAKATVSLSADRRAVLPTRDRVLSDQELVAVWSAAWR
jgi:hypothetical protein